MRKPSSKMGTAPRFREYTGTDPAGFVASENVARRHLNASQLAIASARLCEVESDRAKKRQVELAGTRPNQTLVPSGTKVEDTGRAAEIVDQKLGIGHRTVNRGIAVVKKGTPEVVKAVENNVMSRARILTLAAQGLKVRDISSLLHIHPLVVARVLEQSRVSQ